MRSSLRFFTVALAVLLLGTGCQIRPRIVQAPATSLPSASSTTPMANGPILAVVQKVGPDAHVTRGGERLPLPPGTVLLPGDEIETASSTLMMLFPETGVSRVEPNSRVTLISDPNAVSSTSLFAELDLIQGSVWTRFERLLGPSEWFSVEANGVVATVRGTGFGVTIVSSGELAMLDHVRVAVADHTVGLSLKKNAILQNMGVAPDEGLIQLVAGQGFDVAPDVLRGMATSRELNTYVRKLSDVDMADPGFVFSSTRLQPATLHLPGVLRRLPKEPLLTTEILERAADLKMIQAAELERAGEATSGFQAPTRGILPSEQAPTGTQVTPVIEGPERNLP